jgi:hypothetical protein
MPRETGQDQQLKTELNANECKVSVLAAKEKLTK